MIDICESYAYEGARHGIRGSYQQPVGWDPARKARS
jgi:hypothetical protein